jgi:heme/copper-type cytochrome/quinol oxidase subunit 3
LSAAHHAHPPTTLGVSHNKLAMWTLLGSECFFFGSLLGTYLSYRGKSINGPYPLDVFNPAVTSISTFDLLASSLFMALAVHYAKENQLDKMIMWLIATAIGGLIFLGFQVYEFTEFAIHGLTPRVNLFGASFFMLTGFHGTHVAVGVLLLLSLCVYAKKGWVTNIADSTEVIGLYWHFVDIVWIVIFTVVYLLEYT